MSSKNYHQGQYELNRTDRHDESEERNLRRSVLTGMRAVLQNYISREEAGTSGGMGNFDTLIHDRIIQWRIYERNRKFKKFTWYFAATFFIVPIAIMIGALQSWWAVGSFAIGVFAVSWVLQYAKTLSIKGHAATDTPEGKRGVQKAIADIWWETILSVRLSYYYALALLFVWVVLALYFSLGNMLVLWYSFILHFFGFSIYMVNPYFLTVLVFIINFASFSGDYLFWKINYPRRSKEKI